jgi:hypothetical protein
MSQKGAFAQLKCFKSSLLRHCIIKIKPWAVHGLINPKGEKIIVNRKFLKSDKSSRGTIHNNCHVDKPPKGACMSIQLFIARV